jgi:hypothetical protein
VSVTAIRGILPETAPAVTDVAVVEAPLASFDERLGGIPHPSPPAERERAAIGIEIARY